MAKLLLLEPIFKGEYKHYLPKKVDSLLQKSVFHIWNDLAPPKHKIDPSSQFSLVFHCKYICDGKQ